MKHFYLILLVLLALVLPQPVHAGSTLKGFVRTNADETMNNTLVPDWVRVGWDAALTEDLNYGSTIWIIDTSSIDSEFPLTAANVEAVVEADNDAFVNKYFVGNEPYLWQSPSAFISNALGVMDTVLAGDSAAEFYFPAGVNTASGPYGTPLWYEDGSWFDAMWDDMGNHSYYKQKVKGFALHAYPDSIGIIDWFRESDEYRDNRFPLRSIIVSEIGRPTSSGNTAYNPTNINNKANLYGIWGWAFYCLEGCVGYYPLWDGGLTDYGEAFEGL